VIKREGGRESGREGGRESERCFNNIRTLKGNI